MKEFEENIKVSEAEIESGKTVLESKPRILMLVLTTRCNLECIMCSRAYPKRDITLPFEKIKQIYDLFPYLEGIDWQGGEVFLVDYFKEMFLKASGYRNINQSIITNGLLIDDEWAKIFAESRASLTYSIDAVTKKTYEYIRRGSRFEDLLKSLDLVRGYNEKYNNAIGLNLNTVVMRSNYKELHLFPEFCARYGVKHLRFDFMQPDVAPPEEDILLNQDADAVNYLKGELSDIKDMAEDNGIWFEYTFGPLLSDNKERRPAVVGVDESCAIPDCKLPWKKLYIDAAGRGEVRPDCLCRFGIGNLMDSSIDAIWNSSVMQAYRRKMACGDVKGWCSQTCISRSVDEHHMEGRC